MSSAVKSLSLIEVAIAICILALISGGMLAVFHQGFTRLEKTQKRTGAYNLAREVMEEYSDWSSLPPNGTYNNPLPYPALINGVTYNVDLTISDGPLQPASLKQISVDVSWNSENYTVETLKADY
ncbi:MAG: hypothetical protein ABH858_05655 [Candidatus Omnitrophota bacterium]